MLPMLQGLKKRFGEEFGLVNSLDMMAFFKRYDRAPSSVGMKGIASIQMLRSEKMLGEILRTIAIFLK